MAPKNKQKKGQQPEANEQPEVPEAKDFLAEAKSHLENTEKVLEKAKDVSKRSLDALEEVRHLNRDMDDLMKCSKHTFQRWDLYFQDRGMKHSCGEPAAVEAETPEEKEWQPTTFDRFEPSEPSWAAEWQDPDIAALQSMRPTQPTVAEITAAIPDKAARHQKIMDTDYVKCSRFTHEIPDFRIIFDLVAARHDELGFSGRPWEEAYSIAMHPLEALVPERGLWYEEDEVPAQPKSYQEACEAVVKAACQVKPTGALKGRARKLARDEAKKHAKLPPGTPKPLTRLEQWLPPPHWPEVSSSERYFFMMTEDFQRRFDKRMTDADVVANALRRPENLATAKAALGKFLDAAIDTAEPLMMQYIAFQDMNMVRLNGDWDRYRDARRLFRKFNPTLPSLMGKRPVSKPKLKRSAAHKAAMQDGADTYEHYIRMGKEHMCELYGSTRSSPSHITVGSEELVNAAREKMLKFRDDPERFLEYLIGSPRFVRGPAIYAFLQLCEEHRWPLPAEVRQKLDDLLYGNV